MNRTLIIGKKDAEELLSLEACIPAMEETFRRVSSQKASMLQRSMMPQEKGNKFALMASDDRQQGICGVKAIIFPGAEARKNGTNQGIIPLFDSATGALLAIVDAEHITVVRTAAASAAATRILAREDSCCLGLLGAGRIGQMHIRAIAQVRPIRRVFVWNRTPDKGRTCCQWAEEELRLEAVLCQTPRQAVEQTDILCTVTQAKEPLVEGSWVKEGAHINAVGACAPTAREVDSRTVCRSAIYLDQRQAALRDGGDLVIPLEKGELSLGNIRGEVGEVLLGTAAGRQSREEITFFESVGIAVQDLSAAHLLYQLALEKGRGTMVELG